MTPLSIYGTQLTSSGNNLDDAIDDHCVSRGYVLLLPPHVSRSPDAVT